MFNFLGFRKDSKKSSADKEEDGGFVIIGETVVEEQRRKMQTMTIARPSTDVIVQSSSKASCPSPSYSAVPHPDPVAAAPSVGVVSAVPDLLGDVPFTLAPHVVALQAGLSLLPDLLLSDSSYNTAHFHYDFTLENSVLHSM